MRFAQFFVCGALIVAGNVFASAPGYVVTVQQDYLPVGGARHVAILPFACPREIDCKDVEKRLTAEVVDRAGLKVTAAATVRKVMTKAGIEKLDNETGHILAESLAVDAFMIVDIQAAEIDAAELKRVKHVVLRLQLVSKDGVTLLAAIGEAHVGGVFTGLSGVAVHTVEAVLKKALPDR